jgi:DNA-binding ferritin-like protein
MSATSTTSKSYAFDAPFVQLEELSEQLLETARKAGTRALDSYEQAVERAIALERKLAGTSRQDWLKQLIESHADLSHELTKAYTTAARTLLSA